MTVPTTSNRVSYSGSTATSLPYTFKIFLDSDLEVYQTSGATTSLLTLNADYTVSGAGSESGGNVVLVAAPLSSDVLTIRRVLPLTQEIDYQPLDPFPAESHEEGLDRGVMLAQQMQDDLDRAVKLAPYSTSTIELILPDPSAGSAIGWNDSGNGLTNDPSLNTINASVAAAAASESAASASESAAGASASSAATSEAAASASEAKAEKWAEETVDTEVESGKYSAKHWSAKAEGYAQSMDFTLNDVGLLCNAGGYVYLPGSGLSNGKALSLTTNWQTIHTPNPPSGYCDYYEIHAQSVDGDTAISISLDGGANTHGYTVLSEADGESIIFGGFMDQTGGVNISVKADAASDALAWCVVRRFPLAADSTSAGAVMPSGNTSGGYEEVATGGTVLHQGGAGSGYCDLVRVFAGLRSATADTITLSDGTNVFVSRELPAEGHQEFLCEICLDGSDTITALAATGSSHITACTVVFRIPTSSS